MAQKEKKWVEVECQQLKNIIRVVHDYVLHHRHFFITKFLQKPNPNRKSNPQSNKENIRRRYILVLDWGRQERGFRREYL